MKRYIFCASLEGKGTREGGCKATSLLRCGAQGGKEKENGEQLTLPAGKRKKEKRHHLAALEKEGIKCQPRIAK